MELSNQLERKKEELHQLSKHLEKQKTENLLYAMLPKHVANQLKEGKKVEASESKRKSIFSKSRKCNKYGFCETTEVCLIV